MNLFVCNLKTIKAAGCVTKMKKMETVGNGELDALRCWDQCRVSQL